MSAELQCARFGCVVARRDLSAEHVRRLNTFFHRCLLVSRNGYINRMNNVQVKNLVLDSNSENILSQRMKLSKLHSLAHVLRMENIRPPYHVLFSVLAREWKKQRGGGQITWKHATKKCKTKLGIRGVASVRGWNPKDPSTS